MIYHRVEELDFELASVPSMPIPQQVLMTSPEHFEVAYVINPHMEGQIGSVDSSRAQSQWADLKAVYDRLGVETHVLAGVQGYPDMVFCANQTLPYTSTDNIPGIVLSSMNAKQRKGEVTHLETFFKSHGRQIIADINAGHSDFEGMGDAIWHPEKRLLWGGYGYRTDETVYEKIAQQLDIRVILLELTDPDFYHLDTCFSVLDSKAVIIYSGAFTKEGIELIEHFFELVIESPEHEARELFSCNAHCPDQKHVIIQRGCVQTNRNLEKAGFIPIEVETGEYLKAGGSVFCMKQMFW